MTALFDEELREQLTRAREELAAAREAGDADGVQAYLGRVSALLRLASRHGIELPHTAEEEQGES